MKTARQLTFALLIAIVCIVLISGIMLLSDPSGRSLQLWEDDVRGSLMKDFAPLAWLLIITAGGTGLIATILTFNRRKKYTAFILAEGIILLLWCIVLIAYISNSIVMIFVFGLVGAALILLSSLIKRQQKDIAEHRVAFSESKDTHHSSVHPKSHYHKHRKRGH